MECPYCRKVDPNGHWRLATIPLSEESEGESKFPETLEDTLGTIGCSICNSEFDPTIKSDVVLVGCGHKFHFDCLGEYCNHRNRFFLIFQLKSTSTYATIFALFISIQFRVECPICHTLEGGDWWHCPYGIHSSDVLDGSVAHAQTAVNTQRSTFLPSIALSQEASSELESDETVGLLESDELEGEERVSHRRYQDDEPSMSWGRRILKKWFIAWTRGASGELRLLRLFVLFIVILAGESAIRSSTLNNPKHNLSEQKELKDKLLILYLSSAIIPMLFCPGVLLLLPSILYIGLLLIKGFGRYYDSELDLILEPISSVCCLFMMVYWIKCNRVSSAVPSSSDDNRSRWRSLDEIYAG